MTVFEREVHHRIATNAEDETLKGYAQAFMQISIPHKYSYNFFWLGRPIIQYPQDIIVIQEIIWQVKPDLIIETGIAHGGSLIFSASILELIGEEGRVLGIDIDIREHNRVEIEKHPMYKRIDMLVGSSIDEKIAEQVYEFAKGKKRVMVFLDSMHTHDHVLKELKLYSLLVTKGSYIVVFDTIIEDMQDDDFPDRPWGEGNNPKTAVWEFLKTNDRFEIDKNIENKLLITVSPDGYLKCVG
jgi:cephalosporin hydroxylase